MSILRIGTTSAYRRASNGGLLTQSRTSYLPGFVFALAVCLAASSAHATVNTVSLQSPGLVQGTTQNVTSPIHFLGTAESDQNITGYVVYVDNIDVFQNSSPGLDSWVAIGPGTHSVYVKAWDSSGSQGSTLTYTIDVVGFAPPTPSASATRIVGLDANSSLWTVDNEGGVGGNCNDGSILPFASNSDPNTSNSPDSPNSGLHLRLTSKCSYDDSLFYRKDTRNPSPYAGDTNFLWDFWFYIPTTTSTTAIQALEHDLFQAVPLSDGVHEFMFGSQCNYATNQWQLWLPSNGGLTWVNATSSFPCKFSVGSWHHATYFLQRVSPSGYQVIPATFGPSSDTNTSLRFGTLTIDGNTTYLGDTAWSTIPNWSPVLGVQHQLDSAQTGVTIDEYIDKESVTVW